MFYKLYKKFRSLAGRVLRKLRAALLTKPAPYSAIHHKTLALCVTEGFDAGLCIEAVKDACGIVTHDAKTGIWREGENALSLEEIKSKYEYIWFLPEDYPVTMEAVLGLLLKFYKIRTDFVLLSWTLKDVPKIAVLPQACSNLVIASERVTGWRTAELCGSYGHVMRLFQIPDDIFCVMKIESFFAERMGIRQDPYYNHREIIFPGGKERVRAPKNFSFHFEKNPTKPLILVFPAFLMVGGVEKNTAGVMEELKDKYDFLMVVFGGLSENNGSMHYQMRRCTIGLYDLSEILRQEQYFGALADIRGIYSPDAVWICNGSEWICDNAMDIRRVFHDIPIIDQEVYDVKEGWITRYREKGIQSFDRFIAINKKIYDRFTGEFNMPPQRVDIIYSVVNLNILSSEKQYIPEQMKRKYGVPEGEAVFAFIGRLSKQKRPLLLVRLFEEINKLGVGNHFMIVGNGDLKEDVRGLVDKLGLKNVTMIDFIDDLNEIYCFLDGIIFVSAYEGLPIVTLEGLVRGVPIISTDVGDVRLVLEEYGAGMIFQNGLNEDITSMSKDFMAFRGQLENYRLSIAARSGEIRNRFSAPSIAEEWDASFKKAIAMKKGEHPQ